MSSRLSAGLLWTLFALLVAAGAYATLTACDLGLGPLFGYRYCAGPQEADAVIAAERERERDLRDRVHSQELRLAQLPVCPPPESPKRAEPKVEDKPPKTEEKTEVMRVPDRISELKGCWESERGDIPLVTDDEEARPLGNVRICFCFRDNGRGQVKFIYTDGVKCNGRISAEIEGGKLLIHQPKFLCGTQKGMVRGRVRYEISCAADEMGAADCDEQAFGYRATFSKERYRRVPNEHCEWSG